MDPARPGPLMSLPPAPLPSPANSAQAHSYSSYEAGTGLPQGLCICCLLCLECSSPLIPWLAPSCPPGFCLTTTFSLSTPSFNRLLPTSPTLSCFVFFPYHHHCVTRSVLLSCLALSVSLPRVRGQGSLSVLFSAVPNSILGTQRRSVNIYWMN